MRIVDGDLFDAPENILVHQCNCVTNKAAHMAKAMFARYPFADIYSGRTTPDVPGTIIAREGYDKTIINLLGQYYPGRPRYPDGKKDGHVARLLYFRQGLFEMSETFGAANYAFPWRIGCGAAGGDWGLYIGALKGFETYLHEAYGAGEVVIYKRKQDK